MAVNKKYYYMRLKENFFDSEEMVLLEAMPEGILYSNILIKMYLKSLKTEGRLMFKETIPYNPQMIATITRHQIGTVEKALNIFKELGLIEVLNDGAIYMNDIELFIGESSTEAERKKAARARIEKEKQLFLEQSGQMSGQMSDKCLPETEIKLKKEKEKDEELKIDSAEQPVKGKKKRVAKATRTKKLLVDDKYKSEIEEIVEFYNSYDVFRKARGMNDDRKKLISNILDKYSVDEVKEAIDNCSKSTWLLQRNFFCFNWIFEDEYFPKILEGDYLDAEYKNNNNTNATPTGTQYAPVNIDNIFGDA